MSSSGRAAGASIPERDTQLCKQAVLRRFLILAVGALVVLGIAADVVLKLAWAESARFRCFSLHGDTALRACERVIAADSPPEIRAEGYYNRGVELDNLDRHVEAVLAYVHAVRLKPDYAAAYTNMGVTLAQLHRWDDAVRAFRAAIRERPDFGDAHYNLGVALAGLRRWAEALEAFREVVRLNPADADALYNSGLMLNFLGRHEEAVQA